MALYLLTDNGIIRTTDNLLIPFDPANRDHQDYAAWVAAGNSADPAAQTVNPHDDTFGNDPWQTIGA